MSEGAQLITAEDLQKFPDDDYRYELVDGRLLRMSPVGWQHGKVVMRLGALLSRYVEDHDLGVVVTEVGFKLASDPDTVRAPDLAFVRRERIPPVDPRGFWQGPPDLAIEVLSPDDRVSEMGSKVEEYLLRGVVLVVVADPDEGTLSIHRRLTPPVVIRDGDVRLELGELIPGFTCALGEIF